MERNLTLQGKSPTHWTHWLRPLELFSFMMDYSERNPRAHIFLY